MILDRKTLAHRARTPLHCSALHCTQTARADGSGWIMAAEEELDKYKRLYEEQKAKVKDLERQNLQLKVGQTRESETTENRAVHPSYYMGETWRATAVARVW